MRDKHIYVADESALLKKIYHQVETELDLDVIKIRRFIWLKFIFYFGFSLFLYISLYLITNPFLFVFCFIAYGFIALLFAFNFSHDFSHNTIFKNKKWNHRCFVFIYTLMGAHAQAWKQRHIQSHHYAPNVEDYDSDLKISKLIRVIPNSDYRWYHRYQHLYATIAYTSYSLFWVCIKDFVILFSDDNKEQNQKVAYHISFWLQKIFYFSYLLVLPMLLSEQKVLVVLLAFILMHLSQSLFLLFTFFMTHHVENTAYPTTDKNGIINTSWLMNQIKSSNDMHPFSASANFILGGFNNHIAHHLFPHVHHIFYPKLNRILYPLLIENKIIPNQTSYWGGIASHLRLLKKMGKEVN